VIIPRAASTNEAALLFGFSTKGAVMKKFVVLIFSLALIISPRFVFAADNDLHSEVKKAVQPIKLAPSKKQFEAQKAAKIAEQEAKKKQREAEKEAKISAIQAKKAKLQAEMEAKKAEQEARKKQREAEKKLKQGNK
jgi:hypothetical protein